MKKVIATGIGVVFLVGIIMLFVKLVFLDMLFPLFKPFVLLIFGPEKSFLVVPVALFMTTLIILLAGFLFSRDCAKKFLTRAVRKVPQGIESSRGALVKLADGSYLIAAKIKKIKIGRMDGGTDDYYILYSPSSPIPWGGLPIIFAKKENVILLKLSFREIYMIAASFGQSTPRVISELKDQSAE
ncbi:MAG: hypothetical protein WC919_04520 [Candidatus Paceibacterota bacterium]|jgi:hypothetical protein|nr:hypothetical protein [Candidatus Paceibacterota bacterium]